MKFFSSVRIDLRRIESIKVGTDITGSRVRAKIVKNKVAAPFKVAEFDIMFNSGISKESDIVDLGEKQGIIKKSGSFYSYNDIKIGQGRENSKKFLKENKDISEKIESEILQSYT